MPSLQLGCSLSVIVYAPGGPIPQNMARALMPRQPYSVAVPSTGGRLHPRFLRKRGLGRKWSPLWLKRDGVIRKNPHSSVDKCRAILQWGTKYKIMKPFLSIKPGATFFLGSSQTLVYHKDSIEVIYRYQSGKKSFYTHVYMYIVPLRLSLVAMVVICPKTRLMISSMI